MESRGLEMQNYVRWFSGIFLIGLAVFGNSYYELQPIFYRTVGVILVVSLGMLVLITTEEGSAALEIILESRSEIRRVVWPTRSETIQTTIIVLIAITIAALLLWGLDSLFSWATSSFLG